MRAPLCQIIPEAASGGSGTDTFGFAYSRLRAVEPAWKGAEGALRGVLPFVVIQLIGLALIAIFPELATLLPALLRN